jgi:hypothetical protein
MAKSKINKSEIFAKKNQFLNLIGECKKTLRTQNYHPIVKALIHLEFHEVEEKFKSAKTFDDMVLAIIRLKFITQSLEDNHYDLQNS